MVGFTKTAAKELAASKIRVNAILPGFIGQTLYTVNTAIVIPRIPNAFVLPWADDANSDTNDCGGPGEGHPKDSSDDPARPHGPSGRHRGGRGFSRLGSLVLHHRRRHRGRRGAFDVEAYRLQL